MLVLDVTIHQIEQSLASVTNILLQIISGRAARIARVWADSQRNAKETSISMSETDPRQGDSLEHSRANAHFWRKISVE